MLHLTLLGGLQLTTDAGALGPSGSQPRRLALLAALAVAGDRGLTRDRLLLLFWPESQMESARTALKQAVFALRRDTGAPELLLGTTTLRLNRQLVACDLWEFEAAIGTGDLARAAALYRGPLLDGVNLEGADEFDPWIDGQREDLRQRYATVLERLARESARDGDAQAALVWWRRLATLESLNTAAAIGLVGALAAAGDRAGAIAHADRHQMKLRAELGLAPDPGLAGLAARLRAQTDPAPSDRPGALTRPEPSPDRAPPRRPRRLAWYAVGLGLLLVAGAIEARIVPRKPGPILNDSVIAVMPFAVPRTEPALATLDKDLVVLLWMKLTGDQGPRAVDPGSVENARDQISTNGERVPSLAEFSRAARELGAGRLVLGAVAGTKDHIEITARLHDARSGRLVTSYTVTGSPDRLPWLVDSLAAGLVVGSYGIDAAQLPELARYKPAAVREYLAGMRPPGAGLSTQNETSQHFANALRIDSTFYMAGFFSYDHGENDPELARWLWTHRAQLSQRDQLLLRPLVGRWVLPDWDASKRIAAFEDLVVRYPDWGAVRVELANTYTDQGAYAGLSGWEPRALALWRRELQDVPTDGDAAEEGFEAAAAAEDTAGARRVLDWSRRAESAPADAWYQRWRIARFFGDQGALRRIWSVLDTLPTGDWIGALYGIARVARVDGRGLGDAEHAVARMAALGEPENWEGVQVAEAGGRFALWYSRRERMLRTASPLDGAEIRVRDALYAGGPAGRDVEDGIQYLRSVLERRPSRRPTAEERASAACWLTQWRLARGQDTAGAAGVIRLLRTLPLPQEFATCAGLLELQLAQRRGVGVQRAAMQLDSISRALPWHNLGGPQFSGVANLVLARLFIQLRQPDLAVSASRRRCYHLWCDGVLWPSQILAQARAEQLVGQVASARHSYQEFLSLRGRADGPWRSEADSARAELRLLGPR